MLKVVVRGLAATPPSNMGLCTHKSWHILMGQHCASGDMKLKNAEDPCAYLSRVYQPDPLAMHQKLKEVCDRLEHLDPLWRVRRKGPASVLPAPPGPIAYIECWVAVWRLGITAEILHQGQVKGHPNIGVRGRLIVGAVQ